MNRTMWGAAVALLVSPLLAVGTTTSAVGDSVGSGGLFVATNYNRIVDTRTGVGGPARAFEAGETRTILVTGGEVPAGAGAVVLDVAVMSSTVNETAVTVWEAGTARPDPMLRAGRDTAPRSNTIVVKPSAAGTVSVAATQGVTDINVDVQGYFTAASASGAQSGGFVPVGSRPVVDTSSGLGTSGGALMADQSRQVQVTGSTTGIPADATSVFANVTVRNQTANGYLRFAPAGSTVSSWASVNYSVGGPEASGMVVPLSSSGAFDIRNFGGSANVVVDVQGYFSGDAAKGGGFTALPATRVVDTVETGAKIPANGERTFRIAGAYGIPSTGVGAVGLVISALDWSENGGLVAYPATHEAPSYVHAPFSLREANTSLATTVVVQPGLEGEITIRNTSGAPVNMRLDVTGWFAEPVLTPLPDGSITDAFVEQTMRSSDAKAIMTGLSSGQVEQFSQIMSRETRVSATVDAGGTADNVAPEEFAENGLGDVDDDGVVSKPTSCRGYSHYYLSNWSLFGMKTAQSWMKLAWCANSGRVVKSSIPVFGSSANVLSWDGSTKQKSNVGWEVRGLTTHKFSFYLGSVTKCLQVRGGANGLYSRSVDCNLS